LHAKGARLEEREYGTNPLTEKELREIIGEGPVTDYLNTRTSLYRERNMKQKPPSKQEAIKLMLRDQNLLKRPVVIQGQNKTVGLENTVKVFQEIFNSR
jgi:arsenate reductase-like glutaredoxin family protein